jgi:hypothetical protein
MGASALGRIFAFPNPVNEYAARITAALVLVFGLSIAATGTGWLLWALAFGFLLRVLWGPRFSPLALLATRVIAPRLGRCRLVPGPPKRFAQGVGLAVSLTAAVLFTAGLETAAWVTLAALLAAAALEAFRGFCLGCAIFTRLQAAIRRHRDNTGITQE